VRFIRWHSVVCGLGMGLFGFAAVAFATRGDDRGAALTAIAALEALAAKKPAVSDALARARQALQRANGARSAGDHEHGALLEGLAREWAETGGEVARTVDTEAEANLAHRRASEAEAKAIRARALIEETIARKGRAAEKLKQLEKPNSDRPASPAAQPPAPKTGADAGASR
jgi:hypothetical protein